MQWVLFSESVETFDRDACLAVLLVAAADQMRPGEDM